MWSIECFGVSLDSCLIAGVSFDSCLIAGVSFDSCLISDHGVIIDFCLIPGATNCSDTVLPNMLVI